MTRQSMQNQELSRNSDYSWGSLVFVFVMFVSRCLSSRQSGCLSHFNCCTDLKGRFGKAASEISSAILFLKMALAFHLEHRLMLECQLLQSRKIMPKIAFQWKVAGIAFATGIPLRTMILSGDAGKQELRRDHKPSA
eukprot:scaffold1169_cov120-Cylindrotheca_fusiformis.AAC.25